MKKQEKKIAVCYCGEPLISTFVFNGAEYWCPECRGTFGMFDVKRVEETPELKFNLVINTARIRKYLDALGTLNCDALRIKGKWVDRRDIPESILQRARKVVNNFREHNTI